MSIQIDNAFIKQFEAEVKAAYQRMGAKLMNTVRRKMSVKGKDTTFQKVGKGSAGQKSKHGLVPLMSIDHTPVTCTLSDWYAGDYVDKLDELKINIDERKVITDAGAYAMGRKSDELLVTAISAATANPLIPAGGTGLTQPKINLAFERLGNNDVPDDGQRYFVIGTEGWTDLLSITAFASSDFIGSDQLPYQGGMIAKRWMGFMWFPFTGLALGAGGPTETRALAYHSTAVGLASGQEIETDVTWVGERQAHFIAHSMSQGAVNIDELGIQTVDYVK